MAHLRSPGRFNDPISESQLPSLSLLPTQSNEFQAEEMRIVSCESAEDDISHVEERPQDSSGIQQELMDELSVYEMRLDRRPKRHRADLDWRIGAWSSGIEGLDVSRGLRLFADTECE